MCQLPFVCGRDESRVTSQRAVVFCLLRWPADRDPSMLLLSINISHPVMNVGWTESQRRLSALTSRVFFQSISLLLFLTSIYSHLCLGQRCVLYFGDRNLSRGKYHNTLDHITDPVVFHPFVSFIKHLL